MRKNTILLFFSIVCVVGNSCKKIDADDSANQYPVEYLKYDVSKSVLLPNLDSIEIKQVIRLEPDSSMPLGQIDKLIVTQDRLFVLDRTHSMYLFVYDRSGDFLFKVGNRGGGPGEYFRGPKDFYVDELTKEIIVFESECRKIFTYDWSGQLRNARFLKKTWPYSFAKSDSMFYFAYKTVDKDSHLLRIEDAKETSFFKYKRLKKKRELVTENCFFTTYSGVFFVEDYNNDVILLKGKNIEKILSFDFGNNSISKDFLTNYSGDKFIKEALSNDKATNISQIVETTQIFAFQFMLGKMKMQIIQNKETGNYLYGISLFTGLFPCEVFASYDNHLVTALSAEYIESLLMEEKDNPAGWEQIIGLAHPAIRDILLQSKEKQAYDYIFIYDVHI